MKLSTRIGVAAIVIALGVSIPDAIAQNNNDIVPAEARQEASETVEVEFGGYVFELPADEPVVACVTFRSQDLSGDDALEYRLFVREPSGEFSSAGLYPSPAIGALSDAGAGDCTSLEGFDDAE